MGIFFGRKREAEKQVPAPSAVGTQEARPEKRDLAPLVPFDEDDPRISARQVLTETSLAVPLFSSDPIEVLWPRVLEAAPRLGELGPTPIWVSRLTWIDSVYVVGIDAPGGSAVVIGLDQGYDSELSTEEILMRIGGRDKAWDFEVVIDQQVSPQLADIVESGSVVQLQSLAPGGSSGSRRVLLPSVHRALRGWERLTHDTYRTRVTDIDGDEMAVYVGVFDDGPAVVYPFLNNYAQPTLEPLAPLLPHIDGWLDKVDETTVVAVRGIAPGEDPNALVKPLVDSVARALAQTR